MLWKHDMKVKLLGFEDVLIEFDVMERTWCIRERECCEIIIHINHSYHIKKFIVNKNTHKYILRDTGMMYDMTTVSARHEWSTISYDMYVLRLVL